MKRISTFLAALVLAMGFYVGPAYAHELQTDGNIGAILHINPDDNPKSGGPTPFYLAFHDKSDQFSLASCDCTLTVEQNGRTIATQALEPTYRTTSENTFTFTEPDVYKLKVTGQPKQAGAFQPFKLTYTLRVAAGQLILQPFPPLLGVGIGLTILLVMLAAFTGVHYHKTKRRKAKGS